ncbi:hypothetical protein FANTH_11250 [Fusarium anthophilum]|uniref:HAT C-terminal dimerisation domain-containing protein n=1 Tax=Fusarium anthophilum TaxID=48485 RepID=A0A8H5DUW5_9HYPO|nr:hypothetical protein FANTH_11250 [Fusarium anthophilum]
MPTPSDLSSQSIHRRPSAPQLPSKTGVQFLKPSVAIGISQLELDKPLDGFGLMVTMFKPKLPPPNAAHPVGFAAIAPNRKSTNQKPMSRRIPGTLKITSAKHTVKVHIAFDGWTSRNRHSFFSINAFFLDDETFQPRKILLGLPNVAMAHTGENICAAVTAVLEEFELVQHNKLGYFVLDNASNNDKAVEELGRKFEWHEPAARRIRCFGHVLHLVATAMLFVHDTQALEDLDPDDFDEWTKRGPLSQYYMIERAIKLRRYLEELVDIAIRTNRKLARSRSKVEKSRISLPSCLEEDNLLTDADWEALNWFSNILAMFNSCLLRLEGDCQVRLRKGGAEAQYGMVWQVAIANEFLLSTLERAKTESADRPESSYLSACINSAWVKINKYYTKLDETPICYAATVLHPGIQWAFLTRAYSGREGWIDKARYLIQTLWEEEYRDLPAQWEIADSNLPVAVRAREYNPFDSFQDELMSYPNSEEESVADEFERWQSTKQDTFSKHDNPLEYWSAKRFEYPRVAKMAIDVLSVPAMAAECERAFFSAGSMVSSQRIRLDASTIAVTQTVRSWLKAGLLEGYDGLLKETSSEVAGVVT